ncbi:tubulin-specific chaperone A isoform X3 [Apus apus]|uniref:tubulin-specific chaperone A isoform X3 n=1 Tax=Apus apus TaxID=8895 RepID=UPI0021F82BB6|nr:tubulin-specific chaperone A isoform X3 [Apus apus]
MADPRLRQIKIKTGVVRRLAKEKVMYEKEAKQQEEKIEKMKAEACDDYGIKKQPSTSPVLSYSVFSCTTILAQHMVLLYPVVTSEVRSNTILWI